MTCITEIKKQAAPLLVWLIHPGMGWAGILEVGAGGGDGGMGRGTRELIDPQLQVAKLENGGETCPDYQANCLRRNTDTNKTAHRRDFPLRQSSDQTDVPTREK